VSKLHYFPVHKSYAVNEQSTNPFDVNWMTMLRHSFIRNWHCLLAAGWMYGRQQLLD